MRSSLLLQLLVVCLTSISLTAGMPAKTWAVSIEPPPGSGAPGGTIGGASRP